jgi:hypothetical protein
MKNMIPTKNTWLDPYFMRYDPKSPKISTKFLGIRPFIQNSQNTGVVGAGVA